MRRLGHAHDLLLQGAAAMAALLIGIVALLVTGDIVLRNLGFGTLPWIVELSEYSLPTATFLAVPWLLRQGQLVRVDTLVTAAPRRVGLALELVADLIGLTISLVFVRYTLAVIADARRLGGLVIKTLIFPEWWLFVPLVFCSVLLAVEFLRRIVAGFARVKARDGR